MTEPNNSDDYLNAAIAAVSSGSDFEALLDQLPVPVYVTDPHGYVIYWNQACVAFAGREPQRGTDRWCVTWELYSTAGDRLPHDKCPMAEAIRQQQPVREEIAIARRPDGSRAAFRPYPTPIFDGDGKMVRAINMLIDVSDEQSAVLADQAGRCRRLADATYDRSTSRTLNAMAEGFARTSADLQRHD